MALSFSAEEAAKHLEGIQDPFEMIAVAARLAPGRTALGTSGQLTGTAILEGVARRDIPIRVFTIDTGRLFPETIAYFKTLEEHYGRPIERYGPNRSELASMLERHGEYLFFDSKARQEYCCEVRKVRPNAVALETVDIWISGLRRDQSRGRAATRKVQIVPQRDRDGRERRIVKLAPLADWTEEETRRFLEDAGAPIHPLLRPTNDVWFYESLGCVICTTPQARWEPRRAGRWRWFNDRSNSKECGIHVVAGDGGGI